MASYRNAQPMELIQPNLFDRSGLAVSQDNLCVPKTLSELMT
jgi:hypothetical protein